MAPKQEVATEVTETTLVSVKDVEKMVAESDLDRLKAQASEGVMNPIMLARFLGIAPQQVYNRIKAGKIQTVTRNDTQKITIPLAEAIAFAADYLDKQAKKQAKIEAELAGL
jgi:hypothetical protein